MDFIELKHILKTDKPSKELRKRKAELKDLIEEFEETYDFDQQSSWHTKDVFEHTLSVVDNVPNNTRLRIAALFHDIGKPFCQTIDENGEGHFYGHWEESEKIFIKYQDNFSLSEEDIYLIRKYILYHDLGVNNNIKTFLEEFQKEDMEELFLLKKADTMSFKENLVNKQLMSLETQKDFYDKTINDFFLKTDEENTEEGSFDRMLYLEQLKEKRKFKEELSMCTSYMDWLDNFTKKHGSFSTNSVLCKEDEITKEEMRNINNLEGLYEVIDEYATGNYIDPTKCYDGNFYSIQHNGVGYFIGIDYEQENSFYCTRLEEPEENSLEYKSIMSGVKLPKTILSEYKLEELSNLIEQLYTDGVGLNAITSTAENTIQKIKLKTNK